MTPLVTPAGTTTRTALVPSAGPWDVHVRLDVPDKRRRDPANYAPTIKCLVDGLTDAGWWPDDTPEYVRTHEPELRPVGRRTGLTVTVTIKERT